MANGHGGKRKGAGKPVSSATLIAQQFRAELAKRIQEKSAEWMKAIEDVALGHYAEVTDASGKVVSVYKKAPDPRAWKEGMDRAFGKPAQPVTGADGESPVSVEHTVSDVEFGNLLSRYAIERGTKNIGPKE